MPSRQTATQLNQGPAPSPSARHGPPPLAAAKAGARWGWGWGGAFPGESGVRKGAPGPTGANLAGAQLGGLLATRAAGNTQHGSPAVVPERGRPWPRPGGCADRRRPPGCRRAGPAGPALIKGAGSAGSRQETGGHMGLLSGRQEKKKGTSQTFKKAFYPSRPRTGSSNIDEEFILKQFDIDYQSKPSHDVLHTIKLNQPPLELKKRVGLKKLQEPQFFQKLDCEQKHQKPQNPHKPKCVKMRYGAWYLNTKLWKKQRADEPLVDPKVSCKAQDDSFKKELQEQVQTVAMLQGYQDGQNLARRGHFFAEAEWVSSTCHSLYRFIYCCLCTKVSWGISLTLRFQSLSVSLSFDDSNFRRRSYLQTFMEPLPLRISF
uniref:uncharacterized protein LOC118542132 isoform X7 n=1 Tax=Halichoerus grypus TaxID=9711 RepID=UPI0016599C98|nr:uncharacterized protein LOC118542132 isoform X7 [Halichoerus grypus]